MTSPLAPPALHVLWLCGPPGVGKSVTAWALFHALGDEGVHVAHIDIDQLGMLYPASADDPERHRLKATALAGLLPTYAAAGVQVVVVSGVADPASPAFTDVTLRACTTFCLLTLDEAVLRRRILDRGWAADVADEAVREARALQRAPYLDAVVDTTDHSFADVVTRVRRLLGPASAPGGVLPQPAASSAASTVGMTVVSGPRAAGSSTVGFALARARWANDVPTGFLDLQQLAFVRRPGEPGHSSTTLGLAHSPRCTGTSPTTARSTSSSAPTSRHRTTTTACVVRRVARSASSGSAPMPPPWLRTCTNGPAAATPGSPATT